MFNIGRVEELKQHFKLDLIDIVSEDWNLLWDRELENISLTVGGNRIIWAMKFILNIAYAIDCSEWIWFVSLGDFGVRRPDHFFPLLDRIFGFVRQEKDQTVATCHVYWSFSKPIGILVLEKQILDLLFGGLPLQHCLNNKSFFLYFV